ncbi:MAG TPA: NAD-dependent protein deacetylase [Dermatophilaceae bacterium]|nr:NAD-dependent protein deacetylase [Dermatophilaceae bacterium]
MDTQERTGGTSEDFRSLVDLVARGGLFVLTGAGLSTDSGIPDYRGQDGVRRVMPMQYAEFVATSAARQRYWARSYLGWQRFSAARPNAGHAAVTSLQRAGWIEALVTQNVDGLHTEAAASDVIELHGGLGWVVCLACRERTDRMHHQARLDAANPGFTAYLDGAVADGSRVSSQIRPDGDIVLADEVVSDFRLVTCQSCGSDRLKPDVVFFGESVPKERVERCLAALERSRAVLVLGSSLAVMSGFRFVRRAAALGLPVGIVTRGMTRGDEQATIKIDAPLTPTLSRLVEVLEGAPRR